MLTRTTGPPSWPVCLSHLPVEVTRFVAPRGPWVEGTLPMWSYPPVEVTEVCRVLPLQESSALEVVGMLRLPQ